MWGVGLFFLTQVSRPVSFLNPFFSPKPAVLFPQNPNADSMDRRELAWLLRSLAMMKVYDARLFACLTKAVLRYLTTVLPKETAEHRLRTQAEAAGSRGSVRGGLLSLYNSVDMGLADRSDPINEPSTVFSDLADIVWGEWGGYGGGEGARGELAFGLTG